MYTDSDGRGSGWNGDMAGYLHAEGLVISSVTEGSGGLYRVCVSDTATATGYGEGVQRALDAYA
ncbi:hypothetical protein KIPB_013968, partial [Kipferlia bialata]|eukprot:g13968.t1